MSKEDWCVNDIIQIDPEKDPEMFGACLMIVTEPKSWGAQGFVKIPGSGEAYFRLNKKDGVKVGHVHWEPPEELDDVV